MLLPLTSEKSIRSTMAHQVVSTVRLDPEHNSCIGGRTVLTCRHCAGNAPSSCSGRGFNIFVCAHCNPAAAAQASTPDSSTPNSPASLSRSSSTSLSPKRDLRHNQPWKRFEDGNDGPGGGRVGTNTNRPRGS
ncbi:hypothetical protein P170DRAFT_4260 [Aspergillus steynii IBT 23096]|uniref:Uncharacterized protein n=1 Tax=Aspergillus steynii IBT 23096 TaxID=1392250 RepID=A0A2I2GLJ8_9EURO|nr:uncharacterized protein P170DRAFT_4260 [Aspergillus steynii IBT 23096]PLB53760.1 hypothetical protein P170DRAFT_4260 [Aspergillus steynii IBT 23096]